MLKISINNQNSLNEIETVDLDRFKKKFKPKNLKYVKEIRAYFDPIFSAKDRVLIKSFQLKAFTKEFKGSFKGDTAPYIKGSNIVKETEKEINGVMRKSTKNISIIDYLKVLTEIYELMTNIPAESGDSDLDIFDKALGDKQFDKVRNICGIEPENYNLSQEKMNDDFYECKHVTMRMAVNLIRSIEKEGGYGDENYSVLLSRAKIDLWRMGNFQAWKSSCHNVHNSYEEAAIFEGNGYGFIMFLVKEEDLKKINLDSEEIFGDTDRGIEGIEPLARIRLRMFLETKSNTFVFSADDAKTYGLSKDNKYANEFKKIVNKFCFSKQGNSIQRIREIEDEPEFKFIGGDYIDYSSRSDLLKKIGVLDSNAKHNVNSQYTEGEYGELFHKITDITHILNLNVSRYVQTNQYYFEEDESGENIYFGYAQYLEGYGEASQEQIESFQKYLPNINMDMHETISKGCFFIYNKEPIKVNDLGSDEIIKKLFNVENLIPYPKLKEAINIWDKEEKSKQIQHIENYLKDFGISIRIYEASLVELSWIFNVPSILEYNIFSKNANTNIEKILTNELYQMYIKLYGYQTDHVSINWKDYDF